MSHAVSSQELLFESTGWVQDLVIELVHSETRYIILGIIFGSIQLRSRAGMSRTPSSPVFIVYCLYALIYLVPYIYIFEFNHVLLCILLSAFASRMVWERLGGSANGIATPERKVLTHLRII